MTRILALDPGERVGWNTATVHHERNVGSTLKIDDYGIMPLKKMALAIDGELRGPLHVSRFDVVIFETWVLTAKGARVSVGSDMPSSQFVGIVRNAVWKTAGQVNIVPQPPKDMNTGLLALNHDRPDYDDIKAIIAAAPKTHDDSHYVSSILHTVKYFHKEFA